MKLLLRGALALAATLTVADRLAADERMTLQEALDEAVHNNLTVIAERLRIPVAQAELITAHLRPNPSVTYEVSNLTRANPFRAGQARAQSWSANVPIEAPGKRGLRIETASFAARIAELQLADALRRLRADTASAYAAVVRAKEKLLVARENEKLFDDLVRVNNVRVKAGALAPLELNRSQTAMYLVRTQADRAEIDLATAELKLLTTLGRKARPQRVQVDGGLPPASEFPSVEELEAVGLTHRPDYLAAQLRLQQLDSDLRLQVAEGRIDPVAGVTYQRGGDVDPTPSYGVNISLPLPFFNRNQGEIARARAEKSQAEAEEAALKQEVLSDIRTAYLQYASARRIFDQLRAQLLPTAQQARDTAAYVYRAHGSSLLEFLDAERAYNETMDIYYDAEAASRAAQYQLEAALGGQQ